MKKFDFDLFIIGAGSGGVRAARVAAGLGARVGIAEERHLGGTCVNVGCVPKKLLVYASHYAEEFKGSAGFGWSPGKQTFDWQKLIGNKNHEIARLNQIYKRLIDEAGVDLFEKKAILIDANTVSIDHRTYSAEKILIATGGLPSIPDIPGKEFAITSNEAFFLNSLPSKIVIVGGGYIGVEFAGIFNGLGVDTTLVYRGSMILNGFDTDARKFLTQELQKKGITLILNSNISKITQNNNDKFEVLLTDNTKLGTDLVMYATGRQANTAGLGLDKTGIALDQNGAVVIDDSFQSSVPSIYAIGDVTDRYNLTPVAIAEGMALAHDLFGNKSVVVDYRNIPTCIFSQPNLATVGLSEASAKTSFSEIEVFRSEFTNLKHSLSGIPERTFMKLVVDKNSDRVIGAHMVGSDAGEIIQGIAIAIKAGATKAEFDATIGIHPTAAEEFVTMRQAAS